MPPYQRVRSPLWRGQSSYRRRRHPHPALYHFTVLHDYTNSSVESVRAAVDAALAEADELVARAAASVDTPSFGATMVPLDLGGAAAAAGYGPSAFMSFVHPQAA